MYFFRLVKPALEDKLRLDALCDQVKYPCLVGHIIAQYLTASPQFDHLCSAIHIQRWWKKKYKINLSISLRTLSGFTYHVYINENTTIKGLKQKYWYKTMSPHINRNNYHEKIRLIIMGGILPDDTVLYNMHLNHAVEKITHLNCIQVVSLLNT